MAVISKAQAYQYAANAGFSGNSQKIIVAIAQAESGLNTSIRGSQDPRDRGILQINSYWHPEVSDTCAFDPQCAFNAGYKISSQGTNFSQWATYTSGGYKQFLGGGMGNIPSGSGQPSVPSFLASLFACSSGTCGLWNILAAGGIGNPSQEGGIDVSSKGGTPVYALANGQIVGSGYFIHGGPFNLSAPQQGADNGYGVVTIRCIVPGYPGLQDMYYQHIMIDKSIPLYPNGTSSGAAIAKGQLLGTIVSSVGETEIGFNADWGTIWGPSPHPNPWQTQPDKLIRAMINNDPSFQWGSSSILSQIQTGLSNSPLSLAPNADVAQVLSALDQFGQVKNPFDTSSESIQQDNFFGNSFPDPIGWLAAVGGNVALDTRAILFRTVLLLIGALLIYKAFNKFVDVGGAVKAATNIGKSVALL